MSGNVKVSKTFRHMDLKDSTIKGYGGNIMGKFCFSNLKTLYADMKRKNEVRSIFSIEIKDKGFNCIFIIDTEPFRLYLTTLGKFPVVLEFEVEAGFKVNDYLDGDTYKALLNYLEIEFDPNYKFRPKNFFELVNSKIPSDHKESPGYRKVLNLARKTRCIEDEDKRYFCGWRKNPEGKHVTKENLEKTTAAFGKKYANLSIRYNMSSCWTDISSKEQIGRLNQLVSDID